MNIEKPKPAQRVYVQVTDPNTGESKGRTIYSTTVEGYWDWFDRKIDEDQRPRRPKQAASA